MEQKVDLIACRLNQYPSGKEDELLKLFLGRQNYWWTQYRFILVEMKDL